MGVFLWTLSLVLLLAPGARAEWGVQSHNDTKYCGGVTPRGATSWSEAQRTPADDTESNVRGLYVTIGADMCDFKNPTYIASIIGTTNAGTLFRLTHTLFDVTKDGFRVYLYNPTHWAHDRGSDEMKQLLHQAQHDWQVSWIGAEGKMAGHTTEGSSGWKHNANKSVYLDVDTSKMYVNSICAFIPSVLPILSAGMPFPLPTTLCQCKLVIATAD
jgi:hypothetical protein